MLDELAQDFAAAYNAKEAAKAASFYVGFKPVGTEWKIAHDA